MTRRFVPLLSLTLSLFILGCASAEGSRRGVPRSAPTSVHVDFYTALTPYGEWHHIDVQGWIWVPGVVPDGWRPYTWGTWVYTTYGWTWISEWDWGWVTFHYGRWLRHPRYGWSWIPGYVWAPAWVSWRFGEGWVGWAALPPNARWNVGAGRLLGDVTVGIDWWTFVPDRQLTDPHLRRYAIPGTDRPALLERTRVVTRYEALEPTSVRESGLRPETLERATGIAIPRYRAEDDTHPPMVGQRRSAVDTRVRDGRVKIYRPEVQNPGPSRRTAVRRKPPGKPN